MLINTFLVFYFYKGDNFCDFLIKSVLLASNFAFNSDAAPNYKYMFGPHRGPLPHL